jgi:hypothetical protein
MTAEERALGESRLRNKLLNVERDLVIRTEQANELAELLTRITQTVLHRPADLHLTDAESNQINALQKLADDIRELETRHADLKEKVSKFA